MVKSLSLLPLFLVMVVKCSATPGVVAESVVAFLRLQNSRGLMGRVLPVFRLVALKSSLHIGSRDIFPKFPYAHWSWDYPGQGLGSGSRWTLIRPLASPLNGCDLESPPSLLRP